MAEHAAGVVLAAGAGTRYGMPKVLAGDGNWLRSAVLALHDGGCDDVVVVLGAAIVDVPAPARPVVAGDWAEGMSASLRAGISALESGQAEYAVLMTVDTPDIGADVVRRVLAAARDLAVGYRSGRLRSTTRTPCRHRAPALAGVWSPRCTVTKGRARFWLPAPMWSGWTAPTWRRAPISTSIRERDAERCFGEAADRLLRHLDRIGVVADRTTSSRYPGRASPRPPLPL